ncbi:hypothetical protein P8452_61684 [Trifolium repens]|nr:hypothetical protein P8452_61684 [Trifolium repens]
MISRDKSEAEKASGVSNSCGGLNTNFNLMLLFSYLYLSVHDASFQNLIKRNTDRLSSSSAAFSIHLLQPSSTSQTHFQFPTQQHHHLHHKSPLTLIKTNNQNRS